jgi:hypothetical protein
MAGAILRQTRRLQKLMAKDPKKIVGGKRAGKKRVQELEEMRNPPKEGKKVDEPVRNTRKKRKEDYETTMDYIASQPTRSSFADDITDPRLTYEDRVNLLGGKYNKGGKVKKMEEGGLLDGPQKRATGLKINTGKNKQYPLVRFEDPDVYKRMVEKDAPAVQRMLEEKPKRPLKRPPKGTIYSIDTLNKKVKRFKKGGTVKHKGDGIATRGKTKGKFI